MYTSDSKRASCSSADMRRSMGLFFLGALPPLLFALFTEHAWEDWYITLRAAKNLAMGNGLVYEPGQLLQTFTSPVNVLLPAALSWLVGNSHDDAVLWLYRLVGAGLLGCNVQLLDRLARRQGFSRPAWWFLIGFFVIDGKIMDFTVNGQEAAFMVFFLSLTLVAMLERRTLLLGLAWAGLMWSRPDSFIYIGAISCGDLLSLAWKQRNELSPAMKRFIRAGLLTTLLYAPWIAWTTWYYGTPISHTIVAKGAFIEHLDLWKVLYNFLWFPITGLTRSSVFDAFFMPPYFSMGDWPDSLAVFSRVLAWLAAMAWLCPRVTALVRSASLGTFISGWYLTCFSPYPYPWYFPSCALLAIVTLAGLLHQVLQRKQVHIAPRKVFVGAAAVTLFTWFSVTLCMAWELRVQQRVIESGGREQIGLWLKQQAAGKRQTVFLECLGYIGFYSGLKMYDYPGMSSPEVVEARRIYHDAWPEGNYTQKWAELIRSLQPDWLVLRPSEVRDVSRQDQALLTQEYRSAAVFDQSAAVASYKFLPGRTYLKFDQTFLVFRRVGENRH